MRKLIHQIVRKATLATTIRLSYILLLVPMTAFVAFCIYGLWRSNRQYAVMIDSAVAASGFNLDFKQDFDYETYLLIVGSKKREESKLSELLQEANQVVDHLTEMTTAEANRERLENAKRYLNNLKKYQQKIEENLKEENLYEENMDIWENDVQIVTELLKETMMQYIYYENQQLQKTHQTYRNMYLFLLFWSLVIFFGMLLVLAILSYYIPRTITKPLRELQATTERVAKGDLSVRLSEDTGREVKALSHSFNSMIDRINELLEQIKAEQIHLKNTELDLLQSQINPHFLYNTLDAITWLAEAGESERVVEMVQSLSHFFRVSLSKGREIVTLAEEEQHVASYLEIQKFRYQDILDYEIRISEEIKTCLIPKITLQPLVENALYHGVKNMRRRGKITITSRQQEEYFELIVQDDGLGMKPEQLKEVVEELHRPIAEESERKVYGLYNVNERIALKFGEAYGLTIQSVYQEGTTVTVKLPYERESEKI